MSKETKDNNDFSSFDEYLRQGEPSQKESAENWKTAIGLQAVDGLQPSTYLIDVAKRNIEGEISIEETRKLIDSYYQSKASRTPREEEEEEADKVSSNIAKFISGIWQIHAFREGNTRTTAVFTIQYLRSLGYKVNNEMFAKHSWYFRNALVRANYRNIQKGIEYSPIYLVRFFRNSLLDDGWVLKNRYLHIHPTEEWKVQPNIKNAQSTIIPQEKVDRKQKRRYLDSSHPILPYLLLKWRRLLA